MPRNLYSPKLSDDVVRRLYHEGKRLKMPMTRLADDLLRSALSGSECSAPVLKVCDNIVPYRTGRDPDAA